MLSVHELCCQQMFGATVAYQHELVPQRSIAARLAVVGLMSKMALVFKTWCALLK